MAGEIVLGYDGQEGSVAALRTATGIAAAFQRPLIVVFGFRPAAIGGDVSDDPHDGGEAVAVDSLIHAAERTSHRVGPTPISPS